MTTIVGADAASAIVVNDPPVTPVSVLVFPARDFVSSFGFPAPTDPSYAGPYTVTVIRGGAVVGTSTAIVPTDDPKTATFDGFVDVNHPGGGCWVGFTPDIRAGDVVRVTDAPGIRADQTTTANVLTDPPVEVSFNPATARYTIQLHGTAQDAAGNPLPVGSIESRLVASKLAFDLSGARTLRAGGGGGGGTLSYDAPGSINWTATYVVDQHDRDFIMDPGTTQYRAMWLGRDPALLNENTIYEQNLAPPGPVAGCNAPLAKGPTTPNMTAASDAGASSVDNITSNPQPVFTGTTGNAPAGATVNLYDNPGFPNPPVLIGTGTATAVGFGVAGYSLSPASALADGVHQISVSEVDPVTLVEVFSSSNRAVTIDTVAPAVPTGLTPRPAATSTTLTPRISGVADAGSSVGLFTDAFCTAPSAGSGSAADFNGPGIQVTVGASSISTFSAAATDVAGNVSPCSISTATYAQDSVPPAAPAIGVAPASPSKGNTPSFSFSDADPTVVGFECSMTTGGDAFSTCTSPKGYTVALPDGSYTFKVRVSDAAGNTAVSSAPLVIDTVAPTVTLGGTPANPTNATSAGFTLSASEGGSFACSIDNAPFAICTSPAGLTGLLDGSHTISVHATDAAGNVGSDASHTWVVDTVAPTVQLDTQPPATITTAQSASFAFHSVDGGTSYDCSMVPAASSPHFTSCSSPQSFGPLAPNTYRFDVRARDGAGNVSSVAGTTFTVAVPVAAVTTSVPSVAFGAVNTGATSPATHIVVSSTGSAPLSIAVSMTGADAASFTQTNTCNAASPLAVGANCSIDVSFKPTATGARAAQLVLATNAPASPLSIPLSGTGASAGPTVTVVPAPTLAVSTGTAAGVPVKITWAATAPSGISKYQLQMSTNGGVFAPVALATPLTTSISKTLAPGSYRFQVRATDAGAATSGFVAGPAFTLKADQESSSAIAYSTGWTAGVQAGAFGGSVRFATSLTSTATFSFTGKSFGFLTTKGPNRGKAQVSVDGGAPATVDLFQAAVGPRRMVFVMNGLTAGPHTVVVKLAGKNAAATASRVDVDAFLSLS